MADTPAGPRVAMPPTLCSMGSRYSRAHAIRSSRTPRRPAQRRKSGTAVEHRRPPRRGATSVRAGQLGLSCDPTGPPTAAARMRHCRSLAKGSRFCDRGTSSPHRDQSVTTNWVSTSVAYAPHCGGVVVVVGRCGRAAAGRLESAGSGWVAGQANRLIRCRDGAVIRRRTSRRRCGSLKRPAGRWRRSTADIDGAWRDVRPASTS